MPHVPYKQNDIDSKIFWWDSVDLPHVASPTSSSLNFVHYKVDSILQCTTLGVKASDEYVYASDSPFYRVAVETERTLVTHVCLLPIIIIL